jgi:MFS transporter, ACS family, D-galactonate transporter
LHPSKQKKGQVIILALITIAMMIKYLDLSVTGVAKPALVAEQKISPEVMSFIIFAFFWTCAFVQIRGGLIGAGAYIFIAGPVERVSVN